MKLKSLLVAAVTVISAMTVSSPAKADFGDNMLVSGKTDEGERIVVLANNIVAAYHGEIRFVSFEYMLIDKQQNPRMNTAVTSCTRDTNNSEKYIVTTYAKQQIVNATSDATKNMLDTACHYSWHYTIY